MRLIPLYYKTPVGKLSKYVADTAHYKNWMMWEWIGYKYRLWHVKRRFSLFFITVGCFALGLFHAHKGRNYYTKGAHNGMMQIGDFSQNVMMGMGSDDKKKYYL